MNAREVANWLRRAERTHVLGSLDVELGHFLLERDAEQPLAALATALASQAIAQGHACLPLDSVDAVVVTATPETLRLPSMDALLAALESSPQCTIGGPPDQAHTPLWLDAQRRLYLTRYARHEARVAQAITRLLDAGRAHEVEQGDVEWLCQHLARFHSPTGDAVDGQGMAVLTGFVSPLTVITGGPGTGKTTTVLWLLRALIEHALSRGRKPPSIALAAPTGKAAARLGAALHARLDDEPMDDAVRDAMPDAAFTLHRLLGVRRGSVRFHHDRDHPLDADVVVVDEASMVDLPLMARLFAALKPAARLVLLGDRDQLASVEAGQVLAGICAAAGGGNVSTGRAALIRHVLAGDVPAMDRVPAMADCVVTLHVSHRFGSDGGVGLLAANVRDGEAEKVWQGLQQGRFDGVQWSPSSALPDCVLGEVLPTLAQLPDAADPAQALQLADHIRILTAVRDGPLGCVAINAMLEDALRRAARVGAHARWYTGRLLLVTQNDADAGLFNGDVGIVWADASGRLSAWFATADGVRAFPLSALPVHETGFAMTIHKSQGSEFEQVVVVLPRAGGRMLGRELLYTALTRARRGVHLIADEAAIRHAINRSTRRFSGLADRLSV